MAPMAASSTWKGWLLETAKEWQPLMADLPPILIFLSALIALRSISKNADVNRRRATVDLIEKSESSEHYRTIAKVFKDSFPDNAPPIPLDRLNAPQSEDDTEVRRNVQQFLNHYELVAIGVLGGSLHEKTYRSWMMTVVIRDWNRAAQYIQRERWKYDAAKKKWVYHKKTYNSFEKLARKWARRCSLKVTKISAKTTNPPETPSGPGDVAVPSNGNGND